MTVICIQKVNFRYYRGEIEWEFANPRSSLLRGEYYKFAQDIFSFK